MESSEIIWACATIYILVLIFSPLMFFQYSEEFNKYEATALAVLWPLSMAILTFMFFPKAIQKMSRNLYNREDS